MNQINLSSLLQLAPALKAEPAVIKLVMQQIYQGQLQQLSDGAFRVQLPTAQGPLNVMLPAVLPSSVQQLLNSSQQNASSASNLQSLTATQQATVSYEATTSNGQNPTSTQPTTPSLTNTGSSFVAQPAVINQAAVQLLLSGQSANQLQLIIQAAATTVSIPLTPAQSQQLLLSAVAQIMQSSQQANSPAASQRLAAVAAETIQVNAGTQPKTSVELAVKLQLNVERPVLQLPGLAAVALSRQTVSAINRLLAATMPQPDTAKTSANQSNPVLDFKLLITPLKMQLLQPTITAQTDGRFKPDGQRIPPAMSEGATTAKLAPSVQLSKSEYQLIQQQLRNLINQQLNVTVKDNKLSIGNTVLLPNIPNADQGKIADNQYFAKLQQQGNQWQLLLHSKTVAQPISVDSSKFSMPVQLVNNAINVNPLITTVPQSDLNQQLVQQAWRQLLPMLPSNINTLTADAEVHEVVQQILQTVRHSQPDGTKVMTPPQLINQLVSLLQFQPLQPMPNPQTGAGTLALAIQLLLGNLQQKAPLTSSNPAVQKLSQLVGQLDTAQTSTLLRQLSGHSSTLQQTQLSNIDSNTAAQQLILQLPMQQGEHSAFTQIQLEQREASGKQGAEKQQQWRLTMKFDLQKLGKLLVVATLQQQQLSLQFYTEQPQAKRIADQFLPLLKDRCRAQGLDINSAECTLGKIPESLLPQANSLLTVRV